VIQGVVYPVGAVVVRTHIQDIVRQQLEEIGILFLHAIQHLPVIPSVGAHKRLFHAFEVQIDNYVADIRMGKIVFLLTAGKANKDYS
jgi:hypothetical protein